MKYIVVGPTHPFRGGIAHYTTSLVHHLRRSHETQFLSFSRQYPAWLFPGNAKADPSEVAFEEPNEQVIDALNPLTWFAAARRIVRERPDVLILQWWNPYWLPLSLTLARAAHKAKIPVLFICHHIIEPDSYIRNWTLTTLALRYANGFIVMSEEEYGIVRKVFPWTPVRAGIHPTYDCFPDRTMDKAAARQKLGLADGSKLMLFFGFVRRYKGLRTLIKTLETLPDDYHLLVAGEFWEGEEEYRQLIAEAGLAERVTIHNRYIRNEEVEPYFSAADVVVLPYSAATQSGVGMVALHYGTPVIATDVGGLAETILHEETGLIVPPGNPAALAGAITSYFESNRQPAFRERILRERERLSWGTLVRVVEDISAQMRNK